MRDARARFFALSGLSDDGGYADRFIRFAVGPVRLYVPNTRSRRRAVPLHDLHHVATGYDTSWRGEAQIAAWELGGGCGRYGAAWVLNLLAFPLGVVLAPRRTWDAFHRGRSSRTLYSDEWDECWLDESVGAMRSRLGLTRPRGPAGVSDYALFLVYSLPAIAGIAAVLRAGGLVLRAAW